MLFIFTSWGLCYEYRLTLITAWISNHIPECGMTLLNHSLTSAAAPLGLKLSHVSKRAPGWFFTSLSQTHWGRTKWVPFCRRYIASKYYQILHEMNFVWFTITLPLAVVGTVTVLVVVYIPPTKYFMWRNNDLICSTIFSSLVVCWMVFDYFTSNQIQHPSG